MYEITKDGFMFLVMGFTGKKAAQFKETFIKAFSTMEQELIRRNEIDNLMNTEDPPETPQTLESIDPRIVELCKISDKATNGKTSLRVIEHFTGAPVQDLIQELWSDSVEELDYKGIDALRLTRIMSSEVKKL